MNEENRYFKFLCYEKKRCRFLKDVDYTYMESAGYYECMKITQRILPEGMRFKSAGMGDHDWWYIVKYIDVQESGNNERCIAVIRSWNKYKKAWIYKCIDAVTLLYCIHLDNEYC